MEIIDVQELYDIGEIKSIFEPETGNGDSIIIPDNIKNISVTLEVGGSSSGKIQTTTNKVDDVINDNDVVWVDWDSGIVTVTTQDSSLPVTALRLVRSTGTVRMLIRAQ